MATGVFVKMPVQAHHREQICQAAVGCDVYFGQIPDTVSPEDVNIVIGNLSAEEIDRLPNVRLAQLNSAGVSTAYIDWMKRTDGLRLCNASGAYGLAISEHMFGILLGLQKRLFAYRDQQADGAWRDLGNVASVYGANVLVIGLGDIGGEFARRCKAFGAKVTGVRRSRSSCPEYCDRVALFSDIDRLLPEADIVFMSVPETPQTIGLMSRARINAMKPTAILLNAGRGTAIDTDALVDALREGRLFGAGLDVTDPEPLPEDHPLWKCENAFVTPHVSGGYHLSITHDRIVSIACRNIRACLEGGPLVNEVQPERGY